MAWVDADRIVAAMADARLRRDWPRVQLIRNAMRPLSAAAKRELTVSARACANPRPAIVTAHDFDFQPESPQALHWTASHAGFVVARAGAGTEHCIDAWAGVELGGAARASLSDPVAAIARTAVAASEVVRSGYCRPAAIALAGPRDYPALG